MTHDPAFPALHVRPPTGWVNDPNGPFRWRGRYHLFFQHNPDAPVHGAICWGHASSADLVRWDVEPVALRPSAAGPDRGGCWSGCVVDDDGVPTAVYSGLADVHAETTVCLARAEDGERLRRWHQDPAPVLAPPAGTDWLGFRDPFLLSWGGRRLAVVGGGTRDAGGRVELFACDDLRAWRRLGVLLDLTDPVASEVADAEIWECPQLVRVDGAWVLILSLVKDDTLTRVVWLRGDLVPDGDGWRLAPAAGGLVDHGHDFYAPAVLVEEDRALLWGWTWEDRPEEEVASAGWAGALTFPRVLGLGSDGRLVTAPAPELALLRARPVTLQGPGELAVPTGPVELELAVTTPATLVVDGLAIAVDPVAGGVRLERAVHEPHRRAWPTSGAVPPGPVRLRVLLDGSVVEVYVADGPTFTERVYPVGSRTVALHAEGPVAITAHPLSLPPPTRSGFEKPSPAGPA